jgi:putative transcriptional regulator
VSLPRHASPAVLAGYASGALPSGPSLAVAAHLEACAACREAAGLFERIGGAMIDETAPAPMADDALALALARLERPAPAPVAAATDKTLGDVRLPKAVARQGVGPRRWAAPGIWVAPVRSKAKDDWRTYLLRAPAGMRLPHHDHRGLEFTAVLQGAFTDRTGRYAAGDFAEAEPDLDHSPHVTADGPCLCLISAERGTRASGVLARMLLPLLGI